MIDVLAWLAYFVPMAALALGGAWWLWTRLATKTGEEVRVLAPPRDVRLDDVERQAIFEELFRRRRTGCLVALGTFLLVTATLHPMYAPEGLSQATGTAMYGISVLAGFALGESYAATRAARSQRSERRLASLSPRGTSTYLSPVERCAQLVIPYALAGVAAGLTVTVLTTDATTWLLATTYVCWAWLCATLIAIAAQRWVLAQSPPLDDERDLLVREYVTACAMQQLHKAIWLSGTMAYLVVAGYLMGSQASPAEMLLGYGPAGLALFGVLGYRRWRNLPDPVWHFARVTGSPA